MKELLDTVKERQKRTIQRKVDKGVLDYDARANVFVYKEDGALFKMGEDEEGDRGSEEEDSDAEVSEQRGKETKSEDSLEDAKEDSYYGESTDRSFVTDSSFMS